MTVLSSAQSSAQIVASDQHDTITIACPQCDRRKDVNISTFKTSHVETHKSLKTQCLCGHAFQVTVNTREFPRKRATLTGAYIKFKSQHSEAYGFFIIEDISMAGLKFRTRAPHSLEIGEVVKINFILNDDAGSEIWAALQVKHVQGFSIGGAFCDLKDTDNRMARYLASI
jgi:hypothetical protein